MNLSCNPIIYTYEFSTACYFLFATSSRRARKSLSTSRNPAYCENINIKINARSCGPPRLRL